MTESSGPADVSRIVPLITDTYPLQRLDINNGTPLTTLAADWPWLFTEIGLATHFQLLTGISVKEEMLSSFQTKAGKILKYCQEAVPEQKLRLSCSRIMRNLEEARLVMGSDRPTLIAVILMLMAVFGEDEDSLFILADEHCTVAEATRLTLPATPAIVACGDSILLAKKFMLAVDEVIILNDITSILGALTSLFASFYCLNIQYPETAATTLEFIQRGFIGINPDKGSKGSIAKKRKSVTTNPKILSFIGALADFEWST